MEAESSGKSTAHLGTTRASASDIRSALKFVAKHAGLDHDELKVNLLGSTNKTLSGKQKDSGDIDVAVEEGSVDREEVIQRMLDATGTDEIHRAGAGVFSFAVPVPGDRKVQVDLMFVPSAEWARWSFHSAPDSKYKGAVRSLLFVNLMKQVWEEGRDLELTDPDDGQPFLRVRRSFKADVGLERLFKVRPMRKDGKGRTKSLAKTTPDQVATELRRLGMKNKFDPSPDPITDPDQAAQMMFGKGVTAKDVMSVEQIIALIKKRKDAAIIFKNTMDDLKEQDLEVPPELEEYKDSDDTE
jgi:hypothetical protein